ncbi:class I SAM-dependent methyltransferase [Geobacillus vulcani]
MMSNKGNLDRIFHQDISFDLNEINNMMLSICGIKNFFKDEQEFKVWKEWYHDGELNVGAREFGDFQTPIDLADRVCKVLIANNVNPSIIIEPTFGKGNFIHASLNNFSKVKKVYGVEIQKPYLFYFKKSCLEGKIPYREGITIEVYHDDFFKHEFPNYLLDENEELLIIGNPPWITVAELSRLSSTNIPEKSNIKGYSGLDAITGKSNFDISEYIIIKLLDLLTTAKKGTLAMLCKNSIAKNIVYSIPNSKWNVTTLKMFNFDAKKEFDVVTDASLLLVKIGEEGKDPIHTCDVFNLDEPEKKLRTFGWVNDKFVADVEKYRNSSNIDNVSPLEWRSGVKHDCSKVIELTLQKDNILVNGLKEVVDIENELVYNLLKSSDLKKETIPNHTRKKIIITQNKVGQDTSYIKEKFPKLWNYLNTHKEFFDKRKSSIYKGKPDFSIFGIGDYSFAPYKVAISGMYKESNFSLVIPIKDKPVMLDDTCYFLSFNRYLDAVFTFLILNSDLVQNFLKSLTFVDSKRPYTKDVLMRIDLLEASKQLSLDELLSYANKFDIYIPFGITEEDYMDYIERLQFQPESFFHGEVDSANLQEITQQ